MVREGWEDARWGTEWEEQVVDFVEQIVTYINFWAPVAA